MYEQFFFSLFNASLLEIGGNAPTPQYFLCNKEVFFFFRQVPAMGTGRDPIVPYNNISYIRYYIKHIYGFWIAILLYRSLFDNLLAINSQNRIAKGVYTRRKSKDPRLPAKRVMLIAIISCRLARQLHVDETCDWNKEEIYFGSWQQTKASGWQSNSGRLWT